MRSFCNFEAQIGGYKFSRSRAVGYARFFSPVLGNCRITILHTSIHVSSGETARYPPSAKGKRASPSAFRPDSRPVRFLPASAFGLDFGLRGPPSFILLVSPSSFGGEFRMCVDALSHSRSARHRRLPSPKMSGQSSVVPSTSKNRVCCSAPCASRLRPLTVAAIHP